MNIKKIHFAFDKTRKAQFCKKDILKLHKNFIPKKSNIIVVIGGDGFMLQTLKKYENLKKPFYGMNKGNFGFLMNNYKKNNLINFIKKSKKITISPLQMLAFTNKKKKRVAIAVNEISMLRQSRQTAYLKIKINGKIVIKKLISDGVLVSSPAGSTGYNLSVHGPILSLNSGKLAITPISPFRPRRWKGLVVSQNANIVISNIGQLKRPVSAVADNFEVRNVMKVIIKVNKFRKFNLLYDKNNSLNKKIKIEQLLNKK